MKKVRKSLIVLPAIATLALTTVASVAGTAAWFIQSTTATVTASQFQAEVLNGSLKVATKANSWAGTTDGTTVAATSAAITVDGHLGDASFDYTNLYYAVTNGTAVTGFLSAGGIPKDGGASGTESYLNSPWYQGTNTEAKKVWRAVAWEMTFTSDAVNASSTAKVAVMVDPVLTTFSQNLMINKGLRIAYVSDTGEKIVIGNDGIVTHVNNAGTIDDEHTQESFYSNFAADEFINGDNTPRMSDFAEGLESAKYHLGTLSKDDTSITVQCVAWYEGSDPAVVTTGVNKVDVSATLTFYGANVK